MVKRAAATPEADLEELPEERRGLITAVRRIVVDNLPPGYVETMRWGGLCYEVPLERYPNTYNKQPLMYAALASQKNYCSLYLTAVYQDKNAEAWLQAEFAKAGKKLDDLPLEAIGRAIAGTPVDDFLAQYERRRRHRE